MSVSPLLIFVYQIGTLITTGAFGAGFLPGLIAVAAMAAIVVWLCVRADKKLKAEDALKADKAAVAAKK